MLKEHLASQLRQSKHHKGGKSSVTLINGARNQLEKDKLIGRYNSRLEQTGKRSNLSNTSLNRNMTQRMLLKNQSNFSSVSTIQLLESNGKNSSQKFVREKSEETLMTGRTSRLEGGKFGVESTAETF